MDQYTSIGSNVKFTDVWVTGRLQRNVELVNNFGGTFDINPLLGDVFLVNAVRDTQIQMSSIDAKCVGQSGTIIIVNGPGSSFKDLPENMKTPSGARIEFAINDGAVSIISYLIVGTGSVLCNYIGDFA